MTQDPDALAALKEEMNALMEADDTDFEAVLRLASKISKHEEGVVRFSTDASMVRRLGRELVAKQETALGELVKNAYDADATECTVDLILLSDFATMNFEIVDNGSGMTRDEVERGFMRLSSDEKVRAPLSPRFGRARAGKKGIGRFATERLGRSLTIQTQTEQEANGWEVHIDWSQFEDGSEIGLVANSISPIPKLDKVGTRLTIEGLKDTWTDESLRQVYRYLDTLLKPDVTQVRLTGEDKPRSKHKLASDGSDPGFDLKLRRGGDFLRTETVASSDTEIIGRALARITAKVDDQGDAVWSVYCPRKGINLKLENQPIGLGQNLVEPLEHARNVELTAWYFIKSREFLGSSLQFVKSQLEEYGGIRVYRNGYRVPPYGDKHDDWLRLDEKDTSTYAPKETTNFMGFVAVDDPDGSDFEETSSREGLLSSAAFEEVRRLANNVLTAAVRRIEAARGLGRKPKIGPESGKRASQKLQQAISAFEVMIKEMGTDAASAPEYQAKVQTLLERVRSAAGDTVSLALERDELLAELNLMRILASMGLTIAEFTHDFAALAQTLDLNLSQLMKALPPSDTAVLESAGTFEKQFRLVRAYTTQFNAMTTSNSIRELETVDLYAFARGFAKNLDVMLSRRGLELTVDRPNDYDLRTVLMHPSEWSAILLNLLTNSMKAAQRAGRAGRFLIRMGRLDDQVYLDFYDNGDGIPPENREQVFNAFFTTAGGAPVRASETVRALGTGLGLKIVADIARSVAGYAMVLETVPDGYSTGIRIAVPAAPDPGGAT